MISRRSLLAGSLAAPLVANAAARARAVADIDVRSSALVLPGSMPHGMPAHRV